VYACPFAIHEEFLAGNVRGEGGFQEVWRESELFTRLREPQSGGACTSCQFFDTCKGGCMAAKFFTGLPLDGPDPECVQGYGEELLAQQSSEKPKSSGDHSHRTTPPRPRSGTAAPSGMGPVRLTLSRREDLTTPPVSACAEDPLAGFTAGAESDFATKESGADRRH
jgi:radical SAM protein with 4Fe4S-binding SPASM domain